MLLTVANQTTGLRGISIFTYYIRKSVKSEVWSPSTH